LTVYLSPGFFSHAKYAKISENTFLSWIFSANFTKIYAKKNFKKCLPNFSRGRKKLGEGEEKPSNNFI
jgi:hypothetical protein